MFEVYVNKHSKWKMKERKYYFSIMLAFYYSRVNILYLYFFF